MDACYLHASFGSFYNPTPLFWQGFHNFYFVKFFLDIDMQPLLSVCYHIQCMSFNLEQQNQLQIATCWENEWGSLKLVHFETVRLNRGPQNKLLQNSMFSLSIFFLDIIWKLKCLTTIIQQRNSAFIWNTVTVCIIPLGSLKLVIGGYTFCAHDFLTNVSSKRNIIINIKW